MVDGAGSVRFRRFYNLESDTMFDEDNRGEPFVRPAATIRIFSSTGELLDVIDVPEVVIEQPLDESATRSQQHTTPRGQIGSSK